MDPNSEFVLEKGGFQPPEPIGKIPHVIAPTQFKPTLFKSQTYFKGRHLYTDSIGS